MNITNKLHKYPKVHSKNYVRKKNLNNLLYILSLAIDTQDKSLLVYLTNHWKHYQVNISIENDHDYIINNSNELNYINFLIEDAKYIINVSYE